MNVRKQMSTGDHLKQNLEKKQNPDKKKNFKVRKKLWQTKVINIKKVRKHDK